MTLLKLLFLAKLLTAKYTTRKGTEGMISSERNQNCTQGCKVMCT